MSSTLIDMLNSLKGSIWLHTILSINKYKHDKGHFSIVFQAVSGSWALQNIFLPLQPSLLPTLTEEII